MSKALSQKNLIWKEQEDKIFRQLVAVYGTKHWSKVSLELHQVHGYPLKTGKQCRQRWHNHLNPTINKKEWSKQEQEIMFEQHKIYGNKWTLIKEALPGRTDNSIKNHFYSTIRRCLRRMSKTMGLKNSTVKMRIVKPSTLSIVFTLAEGKQVDGLKQKIEKSELSSVNFKELATELLEFSKWKPKIKNQKIPEEVSQKFNYILNVLEKINYLYQLTQEFKVKQRKQKLLCKKFDDAISSEEDDEEVQLSFPLQLSKQKEFETLDKKQATKPQIMKEEEFTDLKVLEMKVKCSHQSSSAFPQMDLKQKLSKTSSMDERSIFMRENPMCFYLNGEQRESQCKYDFDLGDKMFPVEDMKFSPGFIYLTPQPPTPPNKDMLSSGIVKKSIQNEECNQLLDSLKNRISINLSENNYHSNDNLPLLFKSPGSAFKHYC